MAQPDYQRPPRVLCNTRGRRWTRESSIRVFRLPVVLILQVFSPAKVIFAGIEVLLLVTVLDRCVNVTLTPKSVTGRQRRRGDPRDPRRTLRANRKLFQAPRILYYCTANRSNDRYNRQDYGGSTEHPCSRD